MQEHTYSANVEMSSRFLEILEDADAYSGDCKESNPLDTMDVEDPKC